MQKELGSCFGPVTLDVFEDLIFSLFVYLGTN